MEYNETVHKLFINFKKAHDSVKTSTETLFDASREGKYLDRQGMK
jgi:hypothetical protein